MEDDLGIWIWEALKIVAVIEVFAVGGPRDTNYLFGVQQGEFFVECGGHCVCIFAKVCIYRAVVVWG